MTDKTNTTNLPKIYDGSLIHHRFAYNFFGDKVHPLGNIIGFRGPMEVLAENMIDQEDVNNNDYIYSADAMNFCWEIPSSDAFGGICFQRMFNSQVAVLLAEALRIDSIYMKGDDIMVSPLTSSGIILWQGEDKKASVSISHFKEGANMGHLGLNIEAGPKAPSFAYSCHMSDSAVQEFMEKVCIHFYETLQDVFVASTKIISK